MAATPRGTFGASGALAATARMQFGAGMAPIAPRITSNGVMHDLESTFKTWVNGSTQGRAQLWKAWHSIDYNGNGRVSLAEIDKWVVEQFVQANNKPALMRAYKASIINEKDGYVHKHDFPVLLRNVVYFNKLWSVFGGIDTDGDRRLTYDEFTKGLALLGLGGYGKDAHNIFNQLDTNRGGIILFDEFCKWVASVQCPVDAKVYDPTTMQSPMKATPRAPASNLGQAGRSLMTPRGVPVARQILTPTGPGGVRASKAGAGGIESLLKDRPALKPDVNEGIKVLKQKKGVLSKHASLGVLRLDYDYPPAPGDIDHPDSFGYDVFYRVVPGLTFEMAQSGKMTPAVEREFVEAIRFMEAKDVSGITGDCGFMMYFQELARRHTKKPVFMSSLAQLPAVTCSFAYNEHIAVFTANGKSLAPMRDLIKEECGVDPEESRYIFVGCEDVPGFEAVALGEKVDVPAVTPGIVAKALAVLQQFPTIRAFLFECTEMPPYSDAVRKATGIPVFDSITCCDFFISGFRDNARFGINDWQEDWDGVQDGYVYGQNLSAAQKAMLVNKVH